jgi:hypothetical protein
MFPLSFYTHTSSRIWSFQKKKNFLKWGIILITPTQSSSQSTAVTDSQAYQLEVKGNWKKRPGSAGILQACSWCS